MCGIAGLITKPDVLPNQGVLERMTDSLAHRGPDGRGIWVREGVGFGHRRLAIIDLSERAAQPMHTEDGAYTIVFNGEIYNYRDLREDLERRGSSFRSRSDTEVILESYRHDGKDCVKRLRGMFAFAIWDAREKRCFFARDRAGKKPFFYRTLKDGTIAFASEMKALRFIEPVTVDESALRLFIGLQYVPAPQTGLSEIRDLPPGHRGFMDAHGMEIETYHDWDEIEVERTGDVKDDLLRLLRESVRLRLRADVTVGAFLSGGIDSAACVAVAHEFLSRPLRTFTMGFPYIKMDERKEAWDTARRFGTDHQEFEAQPESLIDLIDKLISQYGGPYADSSALPVMLLSREVAKEIKVVLVGDGGDELFGGYRRYSAFDKACWILCVPGSPFVVAPILRIIAKQRRDPRFERLAETVALARGDVNRGYAELFCGSYFATRRARECFRPEFLQRTGSSDAVKYIRSRMGTKGHPLERAMRFDFDSYLSDDLNVKMDRATMAYGLEARAPFLDQQVVAYALGLPLRKRKSRFHGKVALKQAMKGILPKEVLNRPKRGFQVPLADWFRGSLRGYWMERCLGPASPLAEYARPEAIKRLLEENDRGADHGNRLWMLLSLAVWLDSTKKR
jgi:asparagine synthase (glutamine-hydrolysing)